jgi:hypothetical protein
MITMLEKMAVAMAVCEMRRNGMSEALCEAASAHPQTVAVALENYGPQARAALQAMKEQLDRVILNRGADAAMASVPEMSQHDCNVDADMMQAGLAVIIDQILNEPATG